MTINNSYDVVIVGGGVIGSAAAYFLASAPLFDGSIAVIEKDFTYSKSATALSASSIRQQFSTKENIEMSKYGFDFFQNVGNILAIGDAQPTIDFVARSYLYLATKNGTDTLTHNINIQQRCGVDVTSLTRSDLAARHKWLNVEDVTLAAVTNSGEGWFDAYSLLQAFRAKAKNLGVNYINECVESLIQTNDSNINGVKTTKGTTISAGWVLNCAGAAAYRFGPCDLPVRPRKRCVFVFDCRETIEDCPLIVDPAGFYVRPEGSVFICGMAPPNDNDVDESDFDVDYTLFEDHLWPMLAARVPAFEAIKLVNAWAGHYDYNTFDQNAILGFSHDKSRHIIANGFSGHGLQHAPAIGRALAELVVHGRYVTLDLSSLCVERIAANKPVLEKCVI